MWNWQIHGSLMIDVTFYGKENIPEIPHEILGQREDELGREAQVEDVVEHNKNGTVIPPGGFIIFQRNIKTKMRAKLDFSSKNPVKRVYDGKDAKSDDLMAKQGWKNYASLFIERSLQCTVSLSFSGECTRERHLKMPFT